MRALAGIVGGYVVTALAVMVLARLLPLSPLEATETATLLSFLIFLALVMAAFAVRRLPVLLLGMASAGLALGAVLWLTAPAALP